MKYVYISLILCSLSHGMDYSFPEWTEVTLIAQPQEPDLVHEDSDAHYPCNACNLEYSSCQEYQKHLDSMTHKMKMIVLYRNMAHSDDVLFKNPLTLALEENNHDEDKKSEPSEDSFHSQSSAIQAKPHSYQRPFRSRCPECNKFIIGSIKRHLLTHTGDKPYECSCCGHEFNQSANCARHIRALHHDQKEMAHVIRRNENTTSAIPVSHERFRCKDCNKLFYTKDNFARHTRASVCEQSKL